MNKPRILFIKATGTYIGGVETWLDHASEYFFKNGFDPIVGLVKGMKFNDAKTYQKHHRNLNYVIIDGSGCNRQGRVEACRKTIRKLRPQVIVPLGVADSYEAVLREKDRTNLYLVGRTQDNFAPRFMDIEAYRDGFDHIVCNGRLTRNYLVEYGGFASDRIDHIPNGADQASRIRKKINDENPLRLAYIGRFTQADKRILDIPELCRMLLKNGTPFHLKIVGAGEEQEELYRRLQPFSENVDVLGEKTSEELYQEIFPNVDVLLLFSSSESFGIVLAEAQMNGVVPITSQYTGFFSEQLVVDGKHGLSFPVGDMTTAALKVAELHNDRKLLAKLSKSAKQNAESNYTWKKCMATWDDTLHKVLTKPPISDVVVPVIPRTSAPGRLERLGLHPDIINAMRNVRRKLLGSPVPPGGEEWPLYYSHHTQQRLDEVSRNLQNLEIREKNIVHNHVETALTTAVTGHETSVGDTMINPSGEIH